MNQTTHFTQWKNLTDEQKGAHDFDNYAYDMQMSGIDPEFYTPNKELEHMPVGAFVYRLVIEPGKWYYIETSEMDEEGAVITGDVMGDLAGYYTLRPAKPSEIPKPKATLEDRVKAEYPDFDVVMLEWTDNAAPDANFLQVKTGDEEFEPHVIAQSMRGFYEYVYESDSGLLQLSRTPTYGDPTRTVHPIAVLFTRAEE